MSVTAEAAGHSNRLHGRGIIRWGHAGGMRPDTAHVQVTELAERIINPTPKRTESSSDLFDEFIGENKLKELTGKDDLSAVKFLEISINVDVVSCGNFGSLLPNLRELRLIKSNIPALRDLGTSLSSLEILWMPRACLKCLDGLSSMGNLVELYLAFNEIKDLSSCAMLEQLEVLDLEGNQIAEKSNLSYLKMCSNLIHLTLEGNPIVSCLGGIKSYRRTVWKALPQLKMLDDVPVESEAISKSSEYNVEKFDAEWNYINSLLKEVGLVSENSTLKSVTPGESPRTNGSTSSHSIKPGRVGSGLRPKTGQHRIPTATEGTQLTPKDKSTPASQRPASAITSSYVDDEVSENEETTSGLTTGQVVCGGISGALRSRRVSAKKPKNDPNFLGLLDHQLPQHAEGKDCLAMKTTNDVTKESELEKKSNDVCRVKSSRKLIQGRIDRKKPQKKTALDNIKMESILQEEEQLRAECDAVLKELADWRKSYSESTTFRRRKTAPQILKVHHIEKDNDAVLLSTDSEGTLEDRSGASTRSQPAPQRTPSSLPSIGLDEESRSELSSSSGYESRRTTTAATDYTESPRDANPKPDTLNTREEAASSVAVPPVLKPPIIADQTVVKERDQTSKSTATNSKGKPNTDGLHLTQSANVSSAQTTHKHSGRPSFPPLATNQFSSGSSKVPSSLRTSTDAVYRPRSTLKSQTNANSEQPRSPKGDVRPVGGRNPPNTDNSKRSFTKHVSQALANRLETGGRLAFKLSHTNKSPLPSKPNIQPKT